MSSKSRTGNKRPKRGSGKRAGSAEQTRRATSRGDARAVRPDALCPISNECGACPRIDVPYLLQAARKNDRIHALFDELLDDRSEVDALLGMSEPLRFRDKIASPFAPGSTMKGAGGRARGTQRDVLCGMYAAGTHRIVPIRDCPVEHEAGRKVVAAVRRIMLRYGMEAYDEDAGTGFVRHVVVRVGHESGEVLVTIVTNGAEFTGSKNFCRELVKACPQVTTVVQNINTRQTNAILGGEERVLYGPGFILDTLCGLSFRISSQSFYQVNSMQTERLYNLAISYANEGSGGVTERPRTLVDAYCGTGTIGLVAASALEGAKVFGVDNVESAIRDARLNARHNGIENAEFVVDDAGEYLKRMAARGERLDVLMMDPPRAGASVEFLEAALELCPERIVYISCNPETQVRDVRILREGGYRIARMQPVDMFPHTDHIENVMLLSRVEG